jgi:membrane-associated phospholipid phosphatase
LTIFIIYAPKLWEALITSALLSIIISAVLKRLFAVPRPAAMFDNDSFVIIGKTLTGKSSLPSGHSIATFILITSVLFAFMPQKRKNKIMWSVFVVAAGLFIAFTRVGVGAHYPFDVLIGSTIGFITTTIGIKISSTYNWLQGIGNKKFYPVHLVLLIIWIALLINKIMEDNLVIYYISILALLVTLSLIIRSYVKKN